MARNGRRRPLTPIASIIRARTRATRRSRPANSAGWRRIAHWLPQLIADGQQVRRAGRKFLEGHILAHLIGERPHLRRDPSVPLGMTAAPARSGSRIPIRRCNRCRRATRRSGRSFAACSCRKRARSGASPTSRSRNSASSCTTPCCAICRAPRKPPKHYRSDPNADYHAIVAEMTGLDRDMAKAVNFAKIYGAGAEEIRRDDRQAAVRGAAIYRAVRQPPAVRVPACRANVPGRGRERLATRCSTTAPAGIGTVTKRPTSLTPRAPARARYEEACGAGSIPSIPGSTTRSAARHLHRPQRANSRLLPRATPNCGCAPAAREGIVPLLQMHDASTAR